MSRRIAIALGGVSALAGVVAVLASRRTTKAVQDAVSGEGSPKVKVHLTHYYPFDVRTEAERKVEGAPEDRKKNPLHTVEDFLAGKSDHVSLAGDYTIWPYGQKLLVPWGDRTLVGRVTDTGGHFHGAGKVFRVAGAEPIDVCVFSRDNHPPKSTVEVQVVVGDHLDKSSAVAQLDKTGKPQVAGLIGLDIFTTRSAA